MIQHKRIGIIAGVAICLALAVSILLICFANSIEKSVAAPDYVDKVFGTDIISIEILAEETDWQQMLDNAQSEEYIMADVIVNGTKFTNVGIRPKGNSSLTQVLQSDSDRYSFRLQFDEYIKGQTCFGLKSFVVNNMLGDNTYMKEYVSYDLMKEIGVEAPYFGFADIKVNGAKWGLYLAVELYNDSYEQRVYGDTSGMLYNVKSMDMGGGNNIGNWNTNEKNSEIMNTPPIDIEQSNQIQSQADSTSPGTISETTFNRGNGMKGGMGNRDSNGGSLEYSDDQVSSYSSIFNNVVGKGDDSDYERVIKALKALSEGKDLDTYFQVDQILRYLAAHTIVVNLDSYSSSMAQNYYIYEKDGKLTILPWDYNLAWGGFQNSDATSVINFPIDTPVSGVEMSTRPLLEKLFSNEEYLATYHSYLQELITNYFSEGKLDAKIDQLNTLISDYVKNDPTSFCTYEEYETAVTTFKTLGNLRAQSVQGQLDKTIPSTTANQSDNPDNLITADNLNLSELGSMMGGMNDKQGDIGSNNSFGGNFPGRQNGSEQSQTETGQGGGFQSEEGGTMQGGGFPGGQNGGTQGGNFQGEQNGTVQGGGFPGGQNGMDGPGAFNSTTKTSNTWVILWVVLGILLAGAIIYASKYRKNY